MRALPSFRDMYPFTQLNYIIFFILFLIVLIVYLERRKHIPQRYLHVDHHSSAVLEDK